MASELGGEGGAGGLARAGGWVGSANDDDAVLAG